MTQLFVDNAFLHNASLPLVAAGAVVAVVAGAGFYYLVYSPYRFIQQCEKQGIPFLPFRPLIGQIPEIKSSGDPKPSIIPLLGESDASATASTTGEDHGASEASAGASAASEASAGASAAAAVRNKSEPGVNSSGVPYGPLMHSPLMSEWICKYGDVLGFCIGPSPTILIADPSLVRQVLITKTSSFSKTEASRQILAFLGNGLPLSEGKFWARQRGMLNPAFAPACIQCMAVVMDRQAKLAAQRWTHETRSAGTGSAHEMDVQEALSAVTLDIIGLTAFGESVGGGCEGGESNGGESDGSAVESRAVYTAVSELSERCMQRVFSGRAFIPFYTWLPTEENRAIAAASQRIKSLALRMVAKRRQALKEGEEAHNLLDAMLAARDDEANEQMTDQQLVDESTTFLFGGHETTAKLLTWTMFLLARHPSWQQRLRQEVWRVVGGRDEGGEGGGGRGGGEEGRGGEGGGLGESLDSKGKGTFCVQWEHVGRLEEMGMVLNESLRLFPPVPSLMRQTTKAVQVGSYSFPPNTQLVLPVGYMHGDVRWWGDDAHCFNPERFRNGVEAACSHPQAFLPFSGGPRKCIGYAFALAEANIILCHLLNSLQWRLSPLYVHELSLGITLYAKQGMPLLFDLVDC